MKTSTIAIFFAAAIPMATTTLTAAAAPQDCMSAYRLISALLDPLPQAVQAPFAEEASDFLMADDLESMIDLLATVKTL